MKSMFGRIPLEADTTANMMRRVALRMIELDYRRQPGLYGLAVESGWTQTARRILVLKKQAARSGFGGLAHVLEQCATVARDGSSVREWAERMSRVQSARRVLPPIR